MGFTPFLTSPPNQVGFFYPISSSPSPDFLGIYYQYCKFYISAPKPTKTLQITKNKSPKSTKIREIYRAYSGESQKSHKIGVNLDSFTKMGVLKYFSHFLHQKGNKGWLWPPSLLHPKLLTTELVELSPHMGLLHQWWPQRGERPRCGHFLGCLFN